MEELPFGYMHRQKRSHAQMEGHERSASPAWAFRTRQPSVPFHSSLPLYNNYEPPPPYHSYDEPRTPSFDPASHFSSLYEPMQLPNNAPTDRPSSTSALPYIGRHLPHGSDMASSAPRRFEGDGLDFRRPVSSARELTIDLSRDEDVIDLTADDSGYGASQDENTAGLQGSEFERPLEQSSRSRRAGTAAPRLPRGMDIIIDLDNGEEQWNMASPPARAPSSPEIEFISSRRIAPPRHEGPTSGRRSSDGDEVEFVRENALPHEEVRRRRNQEMDSVMDLIGTMNGRFTHLRAQVDRFNAQVNRTADRFRRGPIVPPRGAPRAHHAHVRIGAFMAPTLDFEMVGFDIGMPGIRAQEPPPPPTYEAPEKAPEGFTRSPEEKDVLVCPNCGDELCTGDDEVKRQVWIVKGCGHVYCGECTSNRSTKRSAKGKERPSRTKPFKECQVEGCGKNVAHRKTMIQIFL